MSGRTARFAIIGMVGVLAGFTFGLLGMSGLAAQPPAGRVSQRDPVDLVLIVDVSYSMFLTNPPTKIPNDPGGIRWDAIQFLIDTASPEDRVALILYRADAALVTRHLDPSGFATLRSGQDSPRHKIKEMVAGCQKFEREFPPNVDGSLGYPIPGQPPLTFSGGGTGSLLALQAVWDPAWNLNFPRTGRQPWVMLFTDGMDERAEFYKEVDRGSDNKTDAKIVWREKAFEYLAAVEKEYYVDEQKGEKPPRAPGEKATADLIAEVAKTVAPYRRAGVPVFTFGLTNPKTTSDYAKAAMRLTLAGISDGTIRDTRDPRFARLHLFNEATNNVELLQQLQEVSWELREQWVLSRGGRGRSLSLTTPDRQLCDDLGVLLYRRVDGLYAHAPDHTVAEVPSLKSRSHHYVPVPTNELGGSNVEAVFSTEADAVAIVGMRLKAPVLDQAKPEKRVYTPIDSIPIQITFDPRDSKLTREMFRATATLRPPGASKERSLTVNLQSADWDGAPNGWAFEGSWVPEDHGRPTGDRVGGMMGDWWLDVVVSIDAKHSPLHGATRRLLRTRVTVGEYPTVTGPAGVVVVSNSGERAGKGELRFTVSPAPITAKDRTPPTLEAELLPMQPEAPAWKGNKAISLGRVPILNGVAVVPVELTRPTDLDWSAVPKDGAKASVSMRSHWARDTAIKGEVSIKKEPYALKLGSDELVFDLSGSTAIDFLPVMLDTRLTTSERVALSTEKDKPGDKLEVASKDKKVSFQLARGQLAFTVPGGKNGELKVQLDRAKDQVIDPGEYFGKLYLMPADEPTTLPAEVKVRVLVNQPELRLRRPRDSKEPSRPLPHIRLSMLAGSKEVLPLEVALLGPGGGNQEILGVKSEKPNPLRLRSGDDPANKFPIAEDWFRAELNPSRFTVALEAPRSVRDGRYATEAVFNVNAQVRPGVPPVAFTVRRAVEIEVHRFAVTADADAPLYSPGPTEDRRLTLDKNKFPGSDAGLELALGTPFTDKDLVVRWWAKILEATPPAGGGAKMEPGENWFDGRIDVRELSDSGPGQSVLGPDARTIPVSKLMEQRLVVTASKLDELTPRVYRCKIRFYGILDGKPRVDEPGVEPPHFDLPISVLVRGRIATVDRQVGENKILVSVTPYGCPPGIGQLRSPDLNNPPQNMPSEVQNVPDGKTLNLKPIDVPTGPGLTRYIVYWPRKWDVLSPPSGVEPPPEDTLPPVQFWRKPQFTLDRKVGAAGDKVTVRLAITPGTFDILNKPVVARVSRNGTVVEEVPLTEDRAERILSGTFTLPTGTPLPPAGDYKIELARELIPTDKAPSGTDLKDLKPDPVVVQLGLEVRKEERALGPIIYGGGFFSSDVVTDPSLLHVTNHTLKDMRYAVQMRYPSARTFEAQELMSAKGEFTPSVHLEFKPTVLEGTLKPGETLDLGAEVGLSADALDAYMNDRPHPTFGTKNGALLVVTMKGTGPDGQEFEWELRHPLIVETQSWRNRGILLSIVAGAFGVVALVYAYRWWRRWINKINTPTDTGGPESPRSPTPPSPEPEEPLGGGVFGGPPA